METKNANPNFKNIAKVVLGGYRGRDNRIVIYCSEGRNARCGNEKVRMHK